MQSMFDCTVLDFIFSSIYQGDKGSSFVYHSKDGHLRTESN